MPNSLSSTISSSSSEAPRSTTPTLVRALALLSEDIVSDDGVANAALAEASLRMAELHALLSECSTLVWACAESEHLLDGFNRRPRPLDDLVRRLQAAIEG